MQLQSTHYYCISKIRLQINLIVHINLMELCWFQWKVQQAHNKCVVSLRTVVCSWSLESRGCFVCSQSVTWSSLLVCEAVSIGREWLQVFVPHTACLLNRLNRLRNVHILVHHKQESTIFSKHKKHPKNKVLWYFLHTATPPEEQSVIIFAIHSNTSTTRRIKCNNICYTQQHINHQKNKV